MAQQIAGKLNAMFDSANGSPAYYSLDPQVHAKTSTPAKDVTNFSTPKR